MLLPFAVAALTACDNANAPALDNSVFISEAADGTTMKKVTIGEEGGTAEFSVRTAEPIAQDASVTVGVTQDALDDYNHRNGTNYELLPADYYTLSDTQLTIKGGEVSTPAVRLTVKPLSTEMSQSGKKYAVPVTVTSTSAGLPLLSVKKSMLYVCDQTIVTDGLYLGHNTWGEFNLNSPLNTNTWTVEFRIASDDIRPSYNNQAFLQIASPSGREGDGFLFCRFEGDLLQFKINGHSGVNIQGTPVSNRWYHIAIVCDNGQVRLYLNGQLNNTLDDAAFKTVAQMQHINFSWGNSEYQRSNFYYSEVRIWNKVRTQTQIANNMYSVDRTSDGLIGYWKCDEGEGRTIHDYTGHGYDFTLQSTGNDQYGWITNVRSDNDNLSK